MSAARIRVQVVHALPQRHWLCELELPAGSTVADAIEASGLPGKIDGLQVDPLQLGIFGRLVKLEDVLHSGDRVEIYRPLLCDPKEVRRRRAVQQRET